MLSVAQVESYYSYFYQRKYKDYRYKLKQSKTTLSVCNNFLLLIDKKYSLHSVGETFLWDYFIFQFQYWHDLSFTNKFSDKIVIGWIVGKKAFERWESRDQQYDWQLETATIIKEYGVNKNDLFADRKQRTKVNSGFDSGKAIRKKYLNTEVGLAMCIEYTTLFNPNDLSCIKCNNKVDCKELLRVNYTKLYQQRIPE